MSENISRSPSITVVIPTFNRADLLSETIDAVLTQTKKADEIIVVDDGSTDNTQALLEKYGATLRSILTKNRGDLSARNVGLKAATGELVAFCDDDDVWKPDFLAVMSSLWNYQPLTAAYSNFQIMRGAEVEKTSKFEAAPCEFWEGLKTFAPGFALTTPDLLGRLINFQPFFPSCMVVDRKAFIKLGGWDEAVSRIVGCDFATALRVASAGPVGISLAPLVFIRKHGKNISGNNEAMNLGDARVLEHFLKTSALDDDLRKNVSASIHQRRQAALDSAFSRRNFDRVKEIASLLPFEVRSCKTHVKTAIAFLPNAIARSLAFLLST